MEPASLRRCRAVLSSHGTLIPSSILLSFKFFSPPVELGTIPKIVSISCLIYNVHFFQCKTFLHFEYALSLLLPLRLWANLFRDVRVLHNS